MAFPGFTSRWTRPASWANANASATLAPISAARSGGRGPSAATMSLSVRPETSSMTMKWTLPSEPVSNTATTPGWFRRAAAWASRRNRRTKAGSRA